MQSSASRVTGGWSVLVVGLAMALAACGGGGGSTPGAAAPPAPDARNGSYAMFAADTHDYTLALDFDARTYRVTGNGMDQAGSFTQDGDTWLFQPGNATGASGSSTARFQVATDAVVGEFALPSGAVPFVAARKFVETVAAAAGTYNFVGRVLDTAGGAPTTTIQQGDITADGRLRTCDQLALSDLASCTTVTTSTLTVSDGLFTAATAAGPVPFRVAQVGADKVFLRAAASNGTTRRFVIGVPATPAFEGGLFVGGSTEPAWGSVTISTTAFSSSGTTPAGASVAMSGTATGVTDIPGLRSIVTAAAGNFFAVRSTEIGAVVATRSSALAPGFVAIGRKQ